MKLISRAITNFLRSSPEIAVYLPKLNIWHQTNDPEDTSKPIITFFAENEDKITPQVTQDNIILENDYITKSKVLICITGDYPEAVTTPEVYSVASLLDDKNKSSLFRQMADQTIEDIYFLKNCFFQEVEPIDSIEEEATKKITYHFTFTLKWQ